MTTIRDELAEHLAEGMSDHWIEEGCSERDADHVLSFLGIDTDLPVEWATVDRCLTWLRERREDDYAINSFDGGRQWCVSVGWDEESDWAIEKRDPTLHAALVAACRAVQDGEP